jgi:preprotein translocase subunit SecY
MSQRKQANLKRIQQMGKVFMAFWLFGLFMFLFGFDLLPKKYFHFSFVLFMLVFVAIWLYGLSVLPAAIWDQMKKWNHPAPGFREPQDGEISIGEYTSSKADKEP